MADSISISELEMSMEKLKVKIASRLLTPKLINIYLGTIDGFIQYCRNEADVTLNPNNYVSRYYELITGLKPYSHPGTSHLKRKARAVLIIRDILKGRIPARKYCYNAISIPDSFHDDIKLYEDWLITEAGCSHNTIKTRIGRIKPFLITIFNSGCTNIEALNAGILVDFIRSIKDGYTSIGKTNILYTIRNFFSPVHI